MFGSPIRPKPLRVLLVDDNPPFADYVAALLLRSGHKVRAVYGGAEALTLAQEFRPHALISDVHMPWMSGFELADAFAESFPECRVLLVTIDPSLVGSGYDHRAYTVLQKPVDLDELMKFLHTCNARD